MLAVEEPIGGVIWPLEVPQVPDGTWRRSITRKTTKRALAHPYARVEARQSAGAGGHGSFRGGIVAKDC